VTDFEKLNRIGEGTYGIVCEWFYIINFSFCYCILLLQLCQPSQYYVDFVVCYGWSKMQDQMSWVEDVRTTSKKRYTALLPDTYVMNHSIP